jgi:hypothetical protein
MPAPSVLHFYGGTADLLRAQALGARAVTVVDDSAARVQAIAACSASSARMSFERPAADARGRLCTC